MNKEDCDHQYYDSFDDEGEYPFNYCPWCGKNLNTVSITLSSENEDDCQKGGCAD